MRKLADCVLLIAPKKEGVKEKTLKWWLEMSRAKSREDQIRRKGKRRRREEEDKGAGESSSKITSHSYRQS